MTTVAELEASATMDHSKDRGLGSAPGVHRPGDGCPSDPPQHLPKRGRSLWYQVHRTGDGKADR